MTSDMKVCMKQRCVVEFLHVETVALTEFDQHLLNIYGGKTMDVSTVRQRMVHFSNSNNNVKDEPCSRWPCTAVTPRNEEHLDQCIHMNWLIVTVLKNSFVAENLLYQIVLLCSSYLL